MRWYDTGLWGQGYPVTSMETKTIYSTFGLHGNGTVLVSNVWLSALDAASAETVFILAIKTAICRSWLTLTFSIQYRDVVWHAS